MPTTTLGGAGSSAVANAEEGEVPGTAPADPRPGSEGSLARLWAERDQLQLEMAQLRAEVARLEGAIERMGSLASATDAQQLVLGLTELARVTTRAPVAMFVPAEPAGTAGASLAYDPGYLAEEPEPARVPLLAGALWRVTPLRLDDVTEWDSDRAFYGRLADGRPLRSWVGAPVRSRYGDALGVLFIAHPEPAAFSQREEDMAQSLAEHLGGTLDNLSLFQERARVAGALQQTLLPPVLPDVPGLEIAARYRPAKALAQVGGDFYDLFEVRPGVWALLLGDVCGIGPEAAALTGVARYATRAIATQESSPGRVLLQLNDTLFRFDLQDRFCTAIYAELRPEAGKIHVRMANGGHPYPFLLRADGQLHEVVTHGTLLGLVPEISVEEQEVVLGPGDIMVAYTDGIVEARDPDGNMFASEGVAAVLPRCAGGHAASVARRIELAVLEHQAGGTPDDMAIIVLQNTSEEHQRARPRRRHRGA